MKIFYLLLLSLISLNSTGQDISIQNFSNTFYFPVAVAHAGDARLFVVEKSGVIKIVQGNGELNEVPFLQLDPSLISTDVERGLFCIAFHPDFENNGYFYINYSRAEDGALVIARYSVSDDPDVADDGSGMVLMTIPHPSSIHYGGTMKFGPDGFLYISTGDGGDFGDPLNLAQNKNEYFGKILRLDVDNVISLAAPGNPYIDLDGLDEVWASGLRNPWKFSFDKQTGDMWIGDVGQNQFEEINKVSQPLVSGLNFGWRCYEGNTVFSDLDCISPDNLEQPFAVYSHDFGCAIIGGYVYRGTAMPSFIGKYLFIEFCAGKVGIVDAQGEITWSQTLPQEAYLTTVGEDINGELYVTGDGVLYKLIEVELGTKNFRDAGLRLYPNPASTEVSISAKNPLNGTIRLSDMMGKTVMSTTIFMTDTSTFNVSGLSAGIYMLSIETAAGEIYSTKLAVK